jgi:hypothetical protein
VSASSQLHSILGRILPALQSGLPTKPSGERFGGAVGAGTAAAAATSAEGGGGRRKCYTLRALRCLVAVARQYESSGQMVQWGWCR